MAYADQQMSGNRVVAIIVVALIHVALGYALITGLAYSAVKKAIERVTTVDIEEPEPEPEEPLPPPPEETVVPPPVAPPPPINISVTPPQIQTVDTPPPPAPPVRIVPPAAPPAPPPPPPPSQARGVQPDGQASWQRRIMENYPPRAVRDEVEGRVGVRVSVGANGRVAACSVTNSSGSSILDDAACQDMTRFARFKPALNDAGNPITASWTTTIVYQLN
jgi:periplasmic protein TonB